jgi:hypothetical protein
MRQLGCLESLSSVRSVVTWTSADSSNIRMV